MTARIHPAEAYRVLAPRQEAAPPQINNDILSGIREFLYVPPLRSGDAQLERLIHGSLNLDSSLPIRSVNRLFNQVARDLLPFRLYWENLLAAPPSGIVDIAAEMEKIERSYVEDPTNPTDKHVRLFRRLMQVFKNYGVKIDRGDPLKITLQDYYELQQKVKDADLERCWPVLRRSILESLPTLGCAYSLFVPSLSANADQIRIYFSKAHSYPLSFVKQIDLSNLRLHHIPNELVYFPCVERLDLQNNHLTDARLENLSINRIRIPQSETIPFPYLQRLLLGNNLIDTNVNRLTHLPNFSVFPSLIHVTMTNIPTMHSFAKLDVSAPLFPRDRSILFEFRGCPVTQYAADHLFEADHLRRADAISYKNLAFLKNYEARSPLGRLYHAVIYRDANQNELEALVAALSEEDQNSLFFQIWQNSGTPQLANTPGGIGSFESFQCIQSKRREWGRAHRFADLDLFKKSIPHAIIGKLHIASPHLELIEHRLWIISGRPMRNGFPVRINYHADFKRLADAVDPSVVI